VGKGKTGAKAKLQKGWGFDLQTEGKEQTLGGLWARESQREKPGRAEKGQRSEVSVLEITRRERREETPAPAVRRGPLASSKMKSNNTAGGLQRAGRWRGRIVKEGLQKDKCKPEEPDDVEVVKGKDTTKGKRTQENP